MKLSDLLDGINYVKNRTKDLWNHIVYRPWSLSDLKHTSVDLPSGGEVIVLDTGPIIDAEAEAMLQALHSRSVGGLRSHLELLAEKGADNFMSKFYVGYGHKSIGDCGTATAFIEGISMLAAKAIQDNPLYSGQESSTRYLDFSQQPLLDPTNSKEGEELLEMQRRFYIEAQEPTREYLKQIYPRGKGEKKGVYRKAIDARVFDITRSLLPAGASTNIAWHTNLRQAADKLLFLRHHPLEEVREVAGGLEEALMKHYPNSFSHEKFEHTEEYQDLIAKHYYFHDHKSPDKPKIDYTNIDFDELIEYYDLFQKRPIKTELPKYLGQVGTIDISYKLDFGSFRDVQRHRALNQRMPLLTQELGFNQWYVENLPPEVRDELPGYLQSVEEKIGELGVSGETEQYFIPMGYNVSNRFTGDIPASVYMVELRDSRFVHPTLQKVAHYMGNSIRNTLGIPIHVDSEAGRFDVQRGEQDIVLR